MQVTGWLNYSQESPSRITVASRCERAMERRNKRRLGRQHFATAVDDEGCPRCSLIFNFSRKADETSVCTPRPRRIRANFPPQSAGSCVTKADRAQPTHLREKLRRKNKAGPVCRDPSNIGMCARETSTSQENGCTSFRTRSKREGNTDHLSPSPSSRLGGVWRVWEQRARNSGESVAPPWATTNRKA